MIPLFMIVVSLVEGGAGTEAPAVWLVKSDCEGLDAEDVSDLVVEIDIFLDHSDDVLTMVVDVE